MIYYNEDDLRLYNKLNKQMIKLFFKNIYRKISNLREIKFNWGR
ncbi:hypothetical protein CLK_2428 [Clostridium botulinum A3 str. Loch Maree]|nr:hypothetical protein CLK_2428 [Clostridium botulinum A3 str. Loch Maree]